MVVVREIMPGKGTQAAEASLLLRRRWKTTDAVVDFVDTHGRTVLERATAVAVVGFWDAWSTAWGHYLYVDDASTVESARGRGHADALMKWVIAEARRRNCQAVHPDSGVGSDRAPAHRLYMRHHLQISAHHFSLEV